MQMRAATLRFHCFLKAGKQEGRKQEHCGRIRCRKVKNNGRLFILICTRFQSNVLRHMKCASEVHVGACGEGPLPLVSLPHNKPLLRKATRVAVSRHDATAAFYINIHTCIKFT